MNIDDFKKLIQDIREQIPCPQCKKKLNSKNIAILGTAFNEAYFVGHCKQCPNNVIIHATLGPVRPHRSLKDARTPIMKVVDQNDILDMHNFLREFNGDFISLFSKKG